MSQYSSRVKKTDLGGMAAKPGVLELPPPYGAARRLVPIRVELKTEAHRVLHVEYLERKCRFTTFPAH